LTHQRVYLHNYSCYAVGRSPRMILAILYSFTKNKDPAFSFVSNILPSFTYSYLFRCASTPTLIAGFFQLGLFFLCGKITSNISMPVYIWSSFSLESLLIGNKSSRTFTPTLTDTFLLRQCYALIFDRSVAYWEGSHGGAMGRSVRS